MSIFRVLAGLTLALTLISAAPIPTAHADINPTTSTGGTCSFYCIPADEEGNARVGQQPLQAMVVVSCTQNADCEQACQSRCERNGTADPDPQGRPTNGLPNTRGRLRCHIPTSPTASTRPRCAESRTGAGGTQPQGQGGGETGGAAPVATGRSAGSQAPIELLNPLGRGVTSIPQLFGRVVRAFMGILGALAMFWFVWGGILWMTAEESKRSEQAQTIMKNAALGLILIFFSYGLTTMFLSLFQELATNARSAGQTTSTSRTR